MTIDNSDVSAFSSRALHDREAANLLYRNSIVGVVMSLFVSAVLVFGFSDSGLPVSKQLWLLCMTIVLVARLADTLVWRKKLRFNAYDGANAIRRFSVGCMATAVLWSVYTIIFIDEMGILEFSSTVCVVSAMAGGAATILAPHKPIAIAYSLILLVPVSLLALLSDAGDRQIFGLLGMFFAIVMATSANKASAFTHQAITLKHDNAELLVQMEKEKQIVNEANANLEEKVRLRTQEIYELSYIDPLTGLSNRKAFSIQLATLLSDCKQRSEKVAILFIDLDGFKAINDSQGHKVGDFVLQEASKRIAGFSTAVRNVCRWGGDEFLIALSNVDQDEALTIARNVISDLSQPIEMEFELLSVGATIGIALYPDHGDCEDQLIRVADTAMYLQKKTAKSEARVFSKHMMNVLAREQFLRDGLAHALSRDQFFIMYQPIVDTVTHKVVSFEALLRWRVDGELISPDEFIPVAEQFGFIKEIGAWVLEQACLDASRWPVDRDVGVSVNVSMIQLMESGFEKYINQAIASSGLDANRLHIEVTESVFAEDKQQLRDVVKTVQNLGVNVSIDDFGTGYSSLSLLQMLGADIVKIDRVFVQKISDGGEPIIQAAMHIAHSLSYKIVAEGVETSEEVRQLEEIGIHYLQGFYFAKPIHSKDVATWLSDQKTNRAF